MKFDIEKTFREIMGMELNPPQPVGQPRKDFDCQKKLDDAKDILQHIRNNWDKEGFDGKEADRMVDDFLKKVR